MNETKPIKSAIKTSLELNMKISLNSFKFSKIFEKNSKTCSE